MAKINVESGGAAPLSTGELQLNNGVAMSSTLTPVTDQSNTASPLSLATTGVQVNSTLEITTDSNPYIDAEDGSGNNRFQVGRDPSSQVVNIDFASNPSGGTNLVGGIRTYTDGVNLAQVMTFRKDGNIGIGTTTPGAKLDVHSGSNTIAQFNRTGTGNSQIQHLMTGTARWSTGYVNTNGNYSFYDDVNAVFRANLSNTGRLTIGNGDNVGTGQLTVRGSGSTSATTSLLVQNSGGTTSLSVNDAGTVTTGGDIFAGTIQIGKGKSTGIYNVAMGQYVLAGLVGSSTASYTIAIGQSTAGKIGSGSYNVIIGTETATNSTAMNNNVIIGSEVFARTTSAISNTLAIGTGTTATYYPTIYATNINTDSPNVRIGNNSAATAAIPTTPTASAIFELSSTTTGFLPPRMTNAERLAIATPAVGLMVYCTDAVEGLYIYKSTGWTFVI